MSQRPPLANIQPNDQSLNVLDKLAGDVNKLLPAIFNKLDEMKRISVETGQKIVANRAYDFMDLIINRIKDIQPMKIYGGKKTRKTKRKSRA